MSARFRQNCFICHCQGQLANCQGHCQLHWFKPL